MNRTSRRARFRGRTVAERFPTILMAATMSAEKAGIDAPLHSILHTINSDIPVELDHYPPDWWQWSKGVVGRLPSELAFLDLEYWFYARVLDLCGFYRSGFDPFDDLKTSDMIEYSLRADAVFQKTRSLAEATGLALYGNSLDLSQATGRAGDYTFGPDASKFLAGGGRPLNVICDNFGGEFIADLVLALRYNQHCGAPVCLHVKEVPLFVSDTTSTDVAKFLGLLSSGSANLEDGSFHRTFLDRLDDGVVSIRSHPFWSSPSLLADIPDDTGILDSHINILKGDLNYRRALGDVDCPVDTAFVQLDEGPKYPMLSLRSVKSHCLAGVDPAVWPAELDMDQFPMDGSIFLIQELPGTRHR